VHVIAHSARDADATGRAFRLQASGYIHHITMYVGAVGNDIADVDADAKSDSSIGRNLAINDKDLLLYLERTPNRAIHAVEHREQPVAAGLDDPTAIRIDGRVDDFAAQPAHPVERSDVIQPDQAAVTDYVGMNHDDQLAPI
jgi:hypothetical protein